VVVPSYILLNKTPWERRAGAVETAAGEGERHADGKLSRGDIYEVYYKYDFRTSTCVCVCAGAPRRFSTAGPGEFGYFCFPPSPIYLIYILLYRIRVRTHVRRVFVCTLFLFPGTAARRFPCNKYTPQHLLQHFRRHNIIIYYYEIRLARRVKIIIRRSHIITLHVYNTI